VLASEPASPTWEQVLADLETETTLLAEGLQRGELLAPVTPWHPPAMPPIPAELVTRAQTLLAQQHLLQAELAVQLAQAPSFNRPRRAPVVEAPAAMLVDLRA